MVDKLSRVFLPIVSILVILFLAEIALRLIPSRMSYDKHLFFSSPSFYTDPHGGVRLARSAIIREVAVYDGTLEYDLIYRTNNEGFIDSVDYHWKKDEGSSTAPKYVFVGDSFTAGSGGFAWVPQLREKLLTTGKKVDVFNFGIPGTGFLHFEKILDIVGEKQTFTHIIVTAISNDFIRPFFTVTERNSKVLFCFDSREPCKMALPIGTVIPFDTTNEDILALASTEKTLTSGQPKYQLVVLARAGVRQLRSAIRRLNAPEPVKKLGTGGEEALKRIRLKFPSAEIHFINLPQKNEVEEGSYEREIASTISDLGIRYFPALEMCEFSSASFHSKDGHPNDLGYGQIQDCVQRYLFPTD